MPQMISYDLTISPLINIKVDKTMKFKNFTILKNNALKELKITYKIKNTDFKDFNPLELGYWKEYPIFVYKINNKNDEVLKIKHYRLVNDFHNMVMLYKSWSVATLLRGGFIHKRIRNRQIPDLHCRASEIVYDIEGYAPMIKIYENEINTMQTFFDLIQSIRNQPHDKKSLLSRVNNAIKWLSYSRRTLQPHDRIIYLNIAMETLVSEQNSEIGYKIAHRIANLVGETDHERSKIYTIIKKCYNIRSEIVHGNSKDDISLRKTFVIQEIVRVLILKCISLDQNGYKKYHVFLNHLDQCLVNHELSKSVRINSNEVFGDRSKISFNVDGTLYDDIDYDIKVD